MSELRWNPQLKQWVVVAGHRQDRTYKPPAEFCPLCPTKPGEFPTEVPAENYEIVVFENRFPSLQYPGPEPDVPSSELYPTAKAEGICEVVLYSSQHDSTLTEASEEHIHHLIQVWTDRYEELGARENIEYVFIFENKGEAVGVTLNHPHGQIYAFPFIPPVVEKELAAAEEHKAKTGRCLYCDILAEEQRQAERIVVDGSSFAAFVPFFARYPFETHLYSKRHLGSLAAMTAEEQRDLASVLKRLLVQYDKVFDMSMPYIMVLHQAPSKGQHEAYHFHFEFYPLNRSETKLKYLAGVESGAGTFITDMTPEAQASRLRGEQ